MSRERLPWLVCEQRQVVSTAVGTKLVILADKNRCEVPTPHRADGIAPAADGRLVEVWVCTKCGGRRIWGYAPIWARATTREAMEAAP